MTENMLRLQNSGGDKNEEQKSTIKALRQELVTIKKGSHRLVTIFETMKRDCQCGAAKRMSDKLTIPPRPAEKRSAGEPSDGERPSKEIRSKQSAAREEVAAEISTQKSTSTKSTPKKTSVIPSAEPSVEMTKLKQVIISPKTCSTSPPAVEKRSTAEDVQTRMSLKRSAGESSSKDRTSHGSSTRASRSMTTDSSQDEVNSSQTPRRRRSVRLQKASSNLSASQASSDSVKVLSLSQSEEAPKLNSSPVFEKEPKKRRSESENVSPSSLRASSPNRPSSPVLCSTQKLPTTPVVDDLEGHPSNRSLSLSRSHVPARRDRGRRGEAPECTQS